MPSKICPRCKTKKDLTAFGINHSGKQKGYPRYYCKPCESERAMEYNHKSGRMRRMTEAKDSSQYLGIVVAEQVLSHYFKEVHRMPHNNPGYDFICQNGYKIDAKSACRRKQENHNVSWAFHIGKNKTADYFMCLAFRDRKSLEPEHMWLIPGKEVNHLTGIGIYNSEQGLARWSEFEKPLDKIIMCCNKMRTE